MGTPNLKPAQVANLKPANTRSLRPTQVVSVLCALCGWLAVIAGIWLLVGFPWALITLGLISVGSAVVLYDPAPSHKKPDKP